MIELIDKLENALHINDQRQVGRVLTELRHMANGKTSTYTRPELTQDEKKVAELCVNKLLRKYGYSNTAKIVAALAIENVRLVKEINEHRAALGIAPLEVYEV
jgi:hypothetical protein